MRRKIVMGLLALGAVAGFGAGFARMGYWHGRHHDHFERRVADVCVEAALRATKQPKN